MKKILGLSCSFLAMSAFADNFVILVDKDQNEYDVIEYLTVVEYSEWVDKGSLTNCKNFAPLTTDIYEGTAFDQTGDCEQPQVRDENTYRVNPKTNERTLVSVVEKSGFRIVQETISKVGSYEALSCLDALNHQSDSSNGYYNIKPNQNKLSAYCDMENGGYTEYKMTAPSDQFTADVEAKCAEEDLQLFIPRTEAHIENAIKEHSGSYFRLMAIYPKTEGARCDTVYFNSVDCLNWKAKDNGKWFVYDWDMTYPHNGGGNGVYPEPNGDNSLNSSMAYGWNNTTGRLSSLNDIRNSNSSSPGGYKTRNWTCSAKDEKNI